MKNISRKNSLYLLAYLLLMIFFLEILLRISIMHFQIDLNLLRIFLFSLGYSFFTLFILRFLKSKYIRVFFILILFLLSLLYFAQDMYFRIFNSFFSFAITGDALLGVTFLGRFIHKITWIHLFYLIPFVSTIILSLIKPHTFKQISRIRYKSILQPVMMIGLGMLVMMISRITIPKTTLIDDESEYNYSDFDLYQEPYSPYLAIKKFGLFTYIRIDLENNLGDETEVDEARDEIADFISAFPEHEINDYTGYFEGKNLILIMAESLDTYAVDPLVMPNLYGMLNNAWYFENYYSPLYYRNTADTEFMTQTSFYPHSGVELSMEAFKDNTFQYTLPRMFADLDYTTMAFHDYTDYFYPRSNFDPNTLGYESYYGAVDMGLLEEPEGYISDHNWPSDTLMMDQVLSHLEGQESFFTYILTVSGHLPYDDTHEIAVANLETITNLFLDNDRELPTESILYYLAAQYEFDQSLGILLSGLAESNQLDNTVIMIYGDHYAYGLDMEDIWEYDTVKEDFSTLDIHNVPMIIYNPTLEKQTITNTMSSIDIMPTISNLFGLGLDYQKVMGQDALDQLPNVVLLSNGSIISDHYSYNIETDTYWTEDDSYLEDAYIMNNYMIHKKLISNMILENDYFYRQEVGVFFITEEKKYF